MGAGYLLGLRLSWPAGVHPRGVWEHAGQAETSSEMRTAMGEYRVGVGNPSHMLLASPGDAMEMPPPIRADCEMAQRPWTGGSGIGSPKVSRMGLGSGPRAGLARGSAALTLPWGPVCSRTRLGSKVT